MIDPTDRPVYGAIHAPSVAPAEAPRRRRGVLPWLVAAAAFAFALGLLTNPWFDRNVRSLLPGVERPGNDAAAAREVAALRARLAVLEARARSAATPARSLAAPTAQPVPVDAAMATRLTELEAELAELRERTDSSITAAAAGADRAQTALLVAALRRAVDGGQRFDAYEPALRTHFGTSHPNEVATLLTFMRRPVSQAQLARSLVGFAPDVERRAAEGRSWWESVRTGLAGVVTVRRAGTPAGDPQGQLQVAAARVERGDVEGALQLIASMPVGARQALAGWSRDARRYLAAQQALAALEVAALTPAPAIVSPPPAPTEF